jgi:hypothetical protein
MPPTATDAVTLAPAQVAGVTTVGLQLPVSTLPALNRFTFRSPKDTVPAMFALKLMVAMTDPEPVLGPEGEPVL